MIVLLLSFILDSALLKSHLRFSAEVLLPSLLLRQYSTCVWELSGLTIDLIMQKSTEWLVELYIKSYQDSSRDLKRCLLRSLKLIFKHATGTTKWFFQRFRFFRQKTTAIIRPDLNDNCICVEETL